MKKLVLFTTLLLGLNSCTQKIGYVDVSKVMGNYKVAKVKENALKIKSDNYEKELSKLVNVWRKKVSDYQGEYNKMTASKRSSKEQELVKEQKSINQRKQNIQILIQQENQNLVDSLSKDINNFVKKFAVKNGYKFVIGTAGNGTVMYGEKNANLTEKIIDGLNKDVTKKESPKKK